MSRITSHGVLYQDDLKLKSDYYLYNLNLKSTNTNQTMVIDGWYYTSGEALDEERTADSAHWFEEAPSFFCAHLFLPSMH